MLPINLPPLRERAEDIPSLVNFYVDAYSTEFKRRIQGVSPEALEKLKHHGWPGNIRELRNAIERAMLLAEGDTLTADDFSASITGAALSERVELPAGGIDLDELERSLLVQALQRTGWNQTKAAGLLGLNRDQIRYRIEKFQLERPSAAQGLTAGFFARAREIIRTPNRGSRRRCAEIPSKTPDVQPRLWHTALPLSGQKREGTVSLNRDNWSVDESEASTPPTIPSDRAIWRHVDFTRRAAARRRADA